MLGVGRSAERDGVDNEAVIAVAKEGEVSASAGDVSPIAGDMSAGTVKAVEVVGTRAGEVSGIGDAMLGVD